MGWNDFFSYRKFFPGAPPKLPPRRHPAPPWSVLPRGAPAAAHLVPVGAGGDLGLVDEGGLDVGQVPLLLGMADLSEDLLFLGVPLVLEGDHLVGSTELRVPPTAPGPRQLRHPHGSAASAAAAGPPREGEREEQRGEEEEEGGGGGERRRRRREEGKIP